MSYTTHSHPDHAADLTEAAATAADLNTQLAATARQIEGYRQARRPVPSDRAWAREWPGLGSPKTWALILAGDLSTVSAAAKLPHYRGVLAALASHTKAYAAEELYEDLAGAQEVSLAALRLMHHHGKDRLILIEGGSGSGKTSALDVLAAGEAAGAMLRLEADETWKSNRVAMFQILAGLGSSPTEIPAPTGERLDKLIATISRKGRIIIAIDEAHHVTGAVLNLCKTLLNRTEALLILAGMETLLQKLRASASEEAKQLFHNRLFARIRLSGPDLEGTREFLSRRLRVPGSWRPATLTSLATAAAHAGHWSYLRRIVDQLAAAGLTDPSDADLLAAAHTAAREIA